MLMPNIYALNHDKYIESYLEGSREITMVNKEFMVFGKHKSNYIFPCMLTIRVLNDDGQDIKFIGTFRTDKHFKNQGYLLINTQGEIDSFSATCLPLMGLDIKDFTKRSELGKKNNERGLAKEKINIKDFLPDFFKNREEYMKGEFAKEKSLIFNYSMIDIVKEKEEFQDKPFNIFVWEIKAQDLSEGFAIRVEPANKEKKKFRKNKSIWGFQFRYDMGRNGIVGEPFSNNGSEGGLSEMVSSLKTGSASESNMLESNTPRENIFAFYAEGITTMQLRKGEIIEVPPEAEELDEGVVRDVSLGQDIGWVSFVPKVPNAPPDRPTNISLRIFKSKEHFQEILNNRVAPHSIRWFKLAVIITSFVFALLGFAEYSLVSTMVSDIQTLVQNLKLVNYRLSNFQSLLLYTQVLILGNMGIIDSTVSSGYLETLTVREDMKAILEELQTNEKTISNNWLKMSMYKEGLMDYRQVEVFYTENGESKTSLYMISEIVDQVAGRFLDVVNTPTEEIYLSETGIKYLTINLLNEMFTGLMLGINDTKEETASLVKEEKVISLYINAAICAIIVFFGLLLFFMLIKVRRIKKEILKLFLDIPEKIIREFYERCEKFVSRVQISEEEDDVSDENEFDDIEEHPAKEDELKTMRKKAQESGKNNLKILLRGLLIIVIFLGFFFVGLYIDYFLFENLGNLATELNTLASFESLSCLVINTVTSLFMNPSALVLSQDARVTGSELIDQLYEHEAQLQRVLSFPLL